MIDYLIIILFYSLWATAPITFLIVASFAFDKIFKKYSDLVDNAIINIFLILLVFCLILGILAGLEYSERKAEIVQTHGKVISNAYSEDTGQRIITYFVDGSETEVFATSDYKEVVRLKEATKCVKKEWLMKLAENKIEIEFK